MTPFEMLREFHEKFGAAIDQPFSRELIELRGKLIDEEFVEVDAELWPNLGEEILNLYDTETYPAKCINKKKLTKELADLMYVTIGTAVTFGLPLEEVFAEVHKSNMSKLGDDGKPITRADGKILKSPNYKEPQLDHLF